MDNMTFCDKISDETKATMRRLTDYTAQTGKEHGIKLCEIDGKIVSSSHCIGNKCSVPTGEIDKLHCPSDSKYEALFHTHPTGRTNPSKGDIGYALSMKHKTTCISSPSKPYIVHCYTIPNDFAKFAQRKIEDREESLQTSDKIGKLNEKDMNMQEITFARSMVAWKNDMAKLSTHTYNTIYNKYANKYSNNLSCNIFIGNNDAKKDTK